MPRRGSPYGGEYERGLAALKRVATPCLLRYEGCTGRALSLDHQPPLALHHHAEGSGCCRLVPSCLRCNLRSGGWRLVNARRGVVRPLGQATPPPSRAW